MTFKCILRQIYTVILIADVQNVTLYVLTAIGVDGTILGMLQRVSQPTFRSDLLLPAS
jgi:hypothetical protein